MPVSIHLRGAGLDALPHALPDALPDVRTAGTGLGAIDAAVAEAFAELHEVDRVFSTWRADSQVSRIRRGELDPADADPQVRAVVRLCEQAREATDGFFEADLPDASGARSFDPTGLVKGWAVQRACSGLAERVPEHDVLVNAGGDIAVSCGRADTPPWRLGIEDPRERTRLLGTVELRAGGLATSGTAARGAHIVSPATGAPASALAAVSVAGPSLMWADVYATAAFAMGVDAADWLQTRTGHTWMVVGPDGALQDHDVGYAQLS